MKIVQPTTRFFSTELSLDYTTERHSRPRKLSTPMIYLADHTNVGVHSNDLTTTNDKIYSPYIKGALLAGLVSAKDTSVDTEFRISFLQICAQTTTNTHHQISDDIIHLGYNQNADSYPRRRVTILDCNGSFTSVYK